MWNNFLAWLDTDEFEEWFCECQRHDFEEEQWEATFASEPSPEELAVMNANADQLLADLWRWHE